MLKQLPEGPALAEDGQGLQLEPPLHNKLPWRTRVSIPAQTALVRNIEKFLLEWGTDFAFVVRQRRRPIDGDGDDGDLVCYHWALRCLALVDLKIGAFAKRGAAPA